MVYHRYHYLHKPDLSAPKVKLVIVERTGSNKRFPILLWAKRPIRTVGERLVSIKTLHYFPMDVIMVKHETDNFETVVHACDE